MGKGFDGSRYQVALPGQVSGSPEVTKPSQQKSLRGTQRVDVPEVSGYPVGCGHRLSQRLNAFGVREDGNRQAFHKAAETLPGCSDQHLKLLYLISLHARCAMSRWESEYWLRRNSLLALVYEAILAGTLDYDYSPEVMVIGKRRVWVNVSQDAQDDIDDLISGKMLRELRMTTRAMQPVSALQVTERGLALVEASPAILHRIVEEFAFTEETDELLKARWAERPKTQGNDGDSLPWDASEEEDLEAEDEEDEEEDDESEEEGAKQAGEDVPWWDRVEEDFGPEDYEVVCVVETDSGAVCRLSGVTRIEDVSYVTSPHLPRLLIDQQRKVRDFADNSSRAHESAKGKSQVKDTFSEAIVLGGVELLVSEWLPFGPNMIASLNERIGSRDRAKGGVFTCEVDTEPGEMRLNTKKKVTEAGIIECSDIDHINLEANISYPERPGIVQVESFGVHISKVGGVLFGMRIEAIMDRVGSGISLDLLSRLVVDAHGDSSAIADALLSAAQREMLEVVFGEGDTGSRTKFNCIFAKDISPAVMAQKYLDGEDRENELRQVLGPCEWAHNLSTEDVVILGRHGMLLAGPHVHRHEDYVQIACSLLTMKVFVQAIFARVLFISQEVLLLRDQIEKARQQQSLLPAIRKELGGYAHAVSLLRSCNNYMADALQTMGNTPLPHALRDPWDITGKELLKCLPHTQWRETLELRLQNLNESLTVCSADLEQCRAITDTIDTLRIHKQLSRIGTYTHICAEASKNDYRDAASILMMVVMVSSTFAWRLMDRFSGADLKQMEWGPNYGYGHRFYSGSPEDCRPSNPIAEDGATGATEDNLDSLTDRNVDMSTEEPCEEGQLASSSTHSNADRWQSAVVAGLSAHPGVLGAVSLLWAAVFCVLVLWIVRYRNGDNDKMVRLQAKLDVPIYHAGYLATYLSSKRLIASRVMEVSGRNVKMVEWQEHDRHGEETAGRFDENLKRLKKVGTQILDYLGIDARCRRRNTTAVAAESNNGDAVDGNTAAGTSGVGVSILMGVRRAAKTLVKAARRRIGWAGLPPRIELIIDLESLQVRSAVFIVDSRLRPDLTEIEMIPMLSRLLIQHLEFAGCVAEGTANQLWPRPTTPGGTLMEGRG